MKKWSIWGNNQTESSNYKLSFIDAYNWETRSVLFNFFKFVAHERGLQGDSFHNLTYIYSYIIKVQQISATCHELKWNSRHCIACLWHILWPYNSFLLVRIVLSVESTRFFKEKIKMKLVLSNKIEMICSC
jgi:hypothetical protein